jgi:hypothetical protein
MTAPSATYLDTLDLPQEALAFIDAVGALGQKLDVPPHQAIQLFGVIARILVDRDPQPGDFKEDTSDMFALFASGYGVAAQLQDITVTEVH